MTYLYTYLRPESLGIPAAILSSMDPRVEFHLAFSSHPTKANFGLSVT